MAQPDTSCPDITNTCPKVRFTIAVMKPHDQKQHEEERDYFIHSSTSSPKVVWARIQARQESRVRELIQKPWKRVLLTDLLSWLAHPAF